MALIGYFSMVATGFASPTPAEKMTVSSARADSRTACVATHRTRQEANPAASDEMSDHQSTATCCSNSIRTTSLFHDCRDRTDRTAEHAHHVSIYWKIQPRRACAAGTGAAGGSLCAPEATCPEAIANDRRRTRRRSRRCSRSRGLTCCVSCHTCPNFMATQTTTRFDDSPDVEVFSGNDRSGRLSSCWIHPAADHFSGWKGSYGRRAGTEQAKSKRQLAWRVAANSEPKRQSC